MAFRVFALMTEDLADKIDSLLKDSSALIDLIKKHAPHLTWEHYADGYRTQFGRYKINICAISRAAFYLDYNLSLYAIEIKEETKDWLHLSSELDDRNSEYQERLKELYKIVEDLAKSKPKQKV